MRLLDHLARFRVALVVVMLGLGAWPAAAQVAETPNFDDDRRLPERQTAAPGGTGAPPVSAKAKLDELEAQARRRSAQAQEVNPAAAEAEAEAKRKADEERRLAAEAEAKRKADEERRLAAEAEAKRKADEEKRLAAEAEAKRKADEEKRLAAEAEAKRKADEEKRLAAEAEAKRKADEEKRLAAEAEARRKADEEKRLSVAVDSKRKAGDPAETTTIAKTIVPKPLAPAAGSCTTKVDTAPLPAGRIAISLDVPCRPQQSLTLRYGEFRFAEKLDASGKASIVLDMFMGTADAVVVEFNDGQSVPASVPAVDLGHFDKVAIVWQTPVALNLHAFEYAAAPGGPGHVWSGAPGSFEEAAKSAAGARGRGFLTSIGEPSGSGAKAQVYTFVRSQAQNSGTVAMAVDYATRGAVAEGQMCGSGALASIGYQVFLLAGSASAQREKQAIAPARCGETLSEHSRLQTGAVPDLRLRRQ